MRPLAGAPETWSFPRQEPAPVRPVLRPACKYGYSQEELVAYLTPAEMRRWNAGYATKALVNCTATFWDPDSIEEFEDDCGPHGPVYRAFEVEEFLEELAQEGRP